MNNKLAAIMYWEYGYDNTYNLLNILHKGFEIKIEGELNYQRILRCYTLKDG